MRTPIDAQHPQKQCFLSLLMLEVLGKDIWHLSCVLKIYKDDTAVLVKHAISMLRTLQYIHKQGYIHRDVKPENYCLPAICRPEQACNADILYIVDMGMAMKWEHPGFSWDKQDYIFYGTVDFASVRSLNGYHPTPKDDLESLACVLMEMATGEAAFSLLCDEEAGKELQQERLLQLARIKEQKWAEYLLQRDTPSYIIQWMRHLRSLPVDKVPTSSDYEILESILRGALSCSAAMSAFSSAAPMQQLHQQSATTVNHKRPAPVLSNTSCVSDTATVMHPKKLKWEQDQVDVALDASMMLNALDDY
eukprot:gene13730-13852_t